MNNQIFNTMMQNSPLGNMQQLATQYKQFRNTFQGDPRQAVQKMLNSGQITQAQIDQAQSMATQLQALFK